MVAGIYQHEEIRLAMIGSDPNPIEPHPGCGVSEVVDVTVPLHILENVDDRFVRVRRRNGMLFFVDLHVELGPARAATNRRASRLRLGLRKRYGRKQKYR